MNGEAAEARARTQWQLIGARSEHEALGVFMHDVRRRWGNVFWRSWARVIRARLPAVGRPDAETLWHSPPPAFARGQGAAAGAVGRRGRRWTPPWCAGRVG